MTGPEHYREAERLLQPIAVDGPPGAWVVEPSGTAAIAMAQVHATLALAAATAYPAVKDYFGDEATDSREWTAATS